MVNFEQMFSLLERIDPQYRKHKEIINEGQETKNMKAAKHYLYDKYGYNERQAMNLIGKIKTDIPNSRLGKCKFMLAMVRMFWEGGLDDGSIIMDVNKCLKYAASNAHINEYDQNLNGLTSSQFIERFSVFAAQDLEHEKNELSSQSYDKQQSQYQIVRIDSFYDSEEYGNYVDWCVTHDEEMFNTYTRNGYCLFYFCLRNGWRNEPEEKGENCPLDSYGLSMIAVSVNEDGSCSTITCRWNHANGGNDQVMTPKQLSQIIKMNFYEVFKPLTKEEIRKKQLEKLMMVQEEIYEYGIENNLDEYCEVLEYDQYYGDVDKRNLYVYTSSDYNCCVVLDETGELITDMTFDRVSTRFGDVMEVENGGKENFLTTQGKLVSETWFDKVSNYFTQGVGIVCQNKKWNIIDRNGKLLLNDWYDAIANISSFGKGGKYVEVIKDKKTNYINVETNEMVFSKPIKYQYMVQPQNLFIKLDGENEIYIYDPLTLRKKAPWKIKALGGYYSYNYYCIEMFDGKEYLIDASANLYDFNTRQKIKDNPYSNQNILA